MNLTNNLTKKWIVKTEEKIRENKEYLTSLDQAIGDGDHGINMARGFQEAVQKLHGADHDSVSDVLKDAAMILMSKVGGASGPLYGTAFLKMSSVLKGKESIGKTELISALEEAVQGIKQRGRADQGEKTMLDVWIPVLEYLKEKDPIDWDQFAHIAKEAMESTKEMLALKGRASYLKERSIGHLDPGSVSSYYFFLSLAETLKEGE